MLEVLRSVLLDIKSGKDPAHNVGILEQEFHPPCQLIHGFRIEVKLIAIQEAGTFLTQFCR